MISHFHHSCEYVLSFSKYTYCALGIDCVLQKKNILVFDVVIKHSVLIKMYNVQFDTYEIK